MAEYTQVAQPMRVETELEDDVLLLEGFSGEEGVSTPFLFELDLISSDGEIDGEEILRSPMRIELDLPDGETRSIHGVVRRFVQRGRDRDLVAYRAEVVPWLWFLSLARDSRIFQEMDVLEIVEEVFKGQGYSDFDIRCTRSYEKREYTVQYRESNLNFVSRLLEEEGIFYFFEHDESGHVLVLADDMSAIKECEGQEEARMHGQAVPDEDVVLGLEREHAVHPGEVTLVDYDYLQPSLTLRSTVAGNEPEEVYDYPGMFTSLDDGEHLADLALEREEAMRQMVRGSATCRAFRSGARFRLLDHYRDDANQAYALLELRQRAYNGSYRAGRDVGEFDFRADFLAIPHSVQYRPPLRARKPVIHGTQTAEVVGPSGEEIWVDEHGRVKIQFHWDRQGSKDENSSCWVRVSQNWAGKNWGGMFIPHIGHEVIVDFLEGDPDRPIITGRVYHAENIPPAPLPANKHKSIIADKFGNELIFDATPGDEHITLYSPHHLSGLVLGRSCEIFSESARRELTCGDEQESTVGKRVKETYGDEFSVTKGTKVEYFGGASGSLKVGMDISAFGGLKASASIGPSFELTVGHKFSIDLSKTHTVSRGKDKKQAQDDISLDSEKKVWISGGQTDQSYIECAADRVRILYGEADNVGSRTAGMFRTPVHQQGKAIASAVGGALSAGVAATLIREAALEKQKLDIQKQDGKENSDREIQGSFTSGQTWSEFTSAVGFESVLVPSIVLLIESLLLRHIEGLPDPEHRDPNAQITLDNDGILLETQSARAKVDLDNTNVEIHADDHLTMGASGKVRMSGAQGVEIEGKQGSTVNIDGNMINIG